jgi:acyl-CoA thioesterase FadM
MSHGYFVQDDHANAAILDKFELDASCVGESVHVFVDPALENRPAPIPDDWRPILEKLL